MSADWQKPMRSLPGPVPSEDLQMTTKEREQVVIDGAKAAHFAAGHTPGTKAYDDCEICTR